MMRRRCSYFLSGILLTVTLAFSAAAQGPVYRERWGYLHLENRRADVLAELTGRSAVEEAKVADLLTTPDLGVPFVPVAKALAHLRGVEADDAFVLRASLGMYVLPEVVDPTATVDLCRNANFSVFLPFSVPVPGAMTFAMTVRNDQGEQVWSETITRQTKLAQVRMAQAKASMPGQDLADGAYVVELRALLDGEPPRKHDPVLRWSFFVQRGYQQRVETALNKALAAREDLGALPRALLDGLAAQVSRAYTGEAFSVRSAAVQELLVLERALQGLDRSADREGSEHEDSVVVAKLLQKLSGQVTAALPVETELGGRPDDQSALQPCVLRMPVDDKPHPLVVFATGAPSYDTGARRPTAPILRESTWLANEMKDFGQKDGWHVAFVDSPGGGRPFADAMLSALKALPQVLPTGGQKPLLVCDREAASVVAMRLNRFAPYIGGVVFVGGGAMPKPVVEGLGQLPVRLVKLANYPGTRAIDRLATFLTARVQRGQVAPDVRVLHERELPWLFGVSRSAAEIREFALDVFGQR